MSFLAVGIDLKIKLSDRLAWISLNMNIGNEQDCGDNILNNSENKDNNIND